MNPLALSAQAVADATGKVTVRLPAPSLGTWWQAAVVVPTAPTGATLALYLAGSKELSWIGPQPSATVVILPSQVLQVEGSGFTGGQIVSVNVRGGWSSGQPQGIAPAGPSSFAMNTFTGKVTAKITGPVTLAATSTVNISGIVDITGPVTVDAATASGQAPPAFVGRTVSAESTVTFTNTSRTWATVIPAPSGYIELHRLHAAASGVATTNGPVFSLASASGGTPFAHFVTHSPSFTFNFEGATLPQGTALWVKQTTTPLVLLQVNYVLRP